MGAKPFLIVPHRTSRQWVPRQLPEKDEPPRGFTSIVLWYQFFSAGSTKKDRASHSRRLIRRYGRHHRLIVSSLLNWCDHPRIPERFHGFWGSGGGVRAGAKLSSNYEPSGNAKTFSGCLDWTCYQPRQDSSDANGRHEAGIFARTATAALEGSRGEAFSGLCADRGSHQRSDHPCFSQRRRTTRAASAWISRDPRYLAQSGAEARRAVLGLRT